MSSPRAVLHIGTMKTGTSTLQATLLNNQERLTAGNYRYLGWPMRMSARISRQLDALDPTTNIIVSDEGLWHFCGTKRSDTKAIADLLAGYEVTIVVYFRRPDEYVEAWFSQGLKKGSGTPSILSFLGSGFVNSAPYRPARDGGTASLDSQPFRSKIDLSILVKLAYYRDIFPAGEIVVRPYEMGQLTGDDIVTDFFAATRLDETIPLADMVRTTNENVSPSADTVLFTSLLRQAYEVPESVLEPFLKTHSPPTMRSSRKTRILRHIEAVTINEIMRPVFQEVQALWGGGGSDDFFLNWEIDSNSFPESDLRDVYDEHLGDQHVRTDEQPAPEV